MLLYINALQNCRTTHWLCITVKFVIFAGVIFCTWSMWTNFPQTNFLLIFLFLEKLNRIREKLNRIREKLNRIRIWSEYAIYLYSRNNQNLFLILSGTGSFIGQYNNILGFITMAAGCSHVNVWYMYIWMMIYVCFIMWP